MRGTKILQATQTRGKKKVTLDLFAVLNSTQLYSYHVLFAHSLNICRASQVALVVKKPPENTEDVRDSVLILGLGISPAGGNGN